MGAPISTFLPARARAHTHALNAAPPPPTARAQWFYKSFSAAELLKKFEAEFGGVSAAQIDALVSAWSGNPSLL